MPLSPVAALTYLLDDLSKCQRFENLPNRFASYFVQLESKQPLGFQVRQHELTETVCQQNRLVQTAQNCASAPLARLRHALRQLEFVQRCLPLTQLPQQRFGPFENSLSRLFPVAPQIKGTQMDGIAYLAERSNDS